MRVHNSGDMKTRLTGLALALLLLPGLASCGQQAPGTSAPPAPAETPAAVQETAAPETAAPSHAPEDAPELDRDEVPSQLLQGIFDEVTKEDSSYVQNKNMYAEYYSDASFEELLEADRITFSFSGTEYMDGGTWSAIEEGDCLSLTASTNDYFAVMLALDLARAVGAYYGQDPDLINGYVNSLDAEGSDDFRIIQNEEDDVVTFIISTAGPYDLSGLDEVFVTEEYLGEEPLDSSHRSMVINVGKITMVLNGSAESLEILVREYGELDNVTLESLRNAAGVLQPAGWEAFLENYTALEETETDEYTVSFEVDDAIIEERMTSREDKYSYALVRFGDAGFEGEYEYTPMAPDAESFAEFYFRAAGGYGEGTAGAALAEARAASDVLSFCWSWDFWAVDTEELRANMLEAWESLTDEERAAFDANFPDLCSLLDGCFDDWESHRGRFADAGVEEDMEWMVEDDTLKESWDILKAHTWTLGNQESDE